MKKKPWHTYKRGRKRHGKYRKSLWCKKNPKNTYEPRIVPKFKFDIYGNKINKSLSNNIRDKNDEIYADFQNLL